MTRFTVQYNLYAGSIIQLGSDDQVMRGMISCRDRGILAHGLDCGALKLFLRDPLGAHTDLEWMHQSRLLHRPASSPRTGIILLNRLRSSLQANARASWAALPLRKRVPGFSVVLLWRQRPLMMRQPKSLSFRAQRQAVSRTGSAKASTPNRRSFSPNLWSTGSLEGLTCSGHGLPRPIRVLEMPGQCLFPV